MTKVIRRGGTSLIALMILEKGIEADEGKDTKITLKDRNKSLIKIMKDYNLDISKIEIKKNF